MSMSVSQYFEYSFIALICLVLIIQNYFNMRHYGHQTLSGRYLLLFVLSLAGVCVLDIAYGLREAGLLGDSIAFAYTVEILNVVVTLAGIYFWFIFSELYQRSKLIATGKGRIIVLVPFLIMSVITFFTPIHHLNFYFDNGHYVRGPLTLVITIVTALILTWTGIGALIKSFRKEFYIEREYFRTIFSYVIIILAFQSLQTILGPVLPFRTIGEGLVIYIIQQKYIKENIYIDNLTGANNRNAADKYLAGRLEKTDNCQIAMIDLDRFKEVNDTYGHQAGDMALKLLADSFRMNLTGSAFFARYGGDEFLLMNTSENLEEIQQIVQNARASLKEKCLQAKAEFDVDFSCGIIQRTPEMKTIPDMLEAADAEMYKNKKEKKAVSRR